MLFPLPASRPNSGHKTLKNWMNCGITLSLLAIIALPVAQARPPKKPIVTPADAAPEKPWPLPAPTQVSRFTLSNGMRVVVQTDHGAPLVAVGIMVDVGARDETQGKSGLAHF